MWNPSDIIPGHLLTVIILAGAGGALLITLIIILCIKLAHRKAKKMSGFHNILFNAKFTYSIDESESNKYYYFVRVNYVYLSRYFTYHIYVPRCKEYLKLAKEEVNRLIINNKLCKFTLKIAPNKEARQYARGL